MTTFRKACEEKTLILNHSSFTAIPAQSELREDKGKSLNSPCRNSKSYEPSKYLKQRNRKIQYLYVLQISQIEQLRIAYNNILLNIILNSVIKRNYI